MDAPYDTARSRPLAKGKRYGPHANSVQILAFWAVGQRHARHNGAKVVLLNELGVSAFLAHYDGSTGWYRTHPSTSTWYRLVRFSVDYSEHVKSRYVANELVFNRKFAAGAAALLSHLGL